MRLSRTTALVILALLLGVGVWMFVSPGERRGGRARAAASEDSAAVEESRDPALATPPAVDEAPRERTALSRDGASAPAEPRTPVAAGESVLLELVLAESGAPAALANVWYRDVAAGEQLEVSEIDGNRLAAGGLELGSVGGFRRDGTKARADERGHVRLPFVAGRGLQVLAELDEHRGAKSFAFAANEALRARLELVRDWELQVQVLHSGGEPAAKISVFLAAREGFSGYSTSGDTGQDGIARFAHAGLRAQEHPGSTWATGVKLPLSEELVHSFDPAQPLDEPIVFRLPPLGEVEVLVLQLDGQPVEDGTNVELGLVRPGQARDLSPFAHGERDYAEERTRAGEALFPYVEPGFEVELRAGREGWQSLARGFFPGPARAGERVRHTLRVEADHPVLVFRALDERSEPLRETSLSLRQFSHAGWTTTWDDKEVRTGGDGRFELHLASGWKEGDEHHVVVTAREGAIGVALDLSRQFEPGPNAMGDLVLRAPPLLAGGRVVDEGGNGVAGAEIHIEYAREEDDWSGGWNGVDLDVKSGEGGAFSARGFALGERVRLTPRQQGKSGAPVECEVGANGVELVLLATGALAGSVLLDEGVPAGQILLALDDGRDEEQAEHDLQSLEPPGEFRFDDRLPGTYTLRVYIADEDDLAQLPGTVIAPGETTRLAPIDLRRRLAVVRLNFLTPEPVADLEGNLTIRSPGDGERMRWHHFNGNPVVLATQEEGLDITCAVKGYRSVRLTDVRGERDVPLQRALQVALVLRPDVALPAPPLYLKATLVAEDQDGQGIDWAASAFDETRASHSLVDGTGRMRVQWILERRSAGGGSATTLDLEPVQWIDVPDSSQAQRFELEVSSEALAKAIADSPL